MFSNNDVSVSKHEHDIRELWETFDDYEKALENQNVCLVEEIDATNADILQLRNELERYKRYLEIVMFLSLVAFSGLFGVVVAIAN